MENPLAVMESDSLTWAEKLAFLTLRFRSITDMPGGCPVQHGFKDGTYIREITIPAGTLFIGRPHRHGHLCKLISGTAVHVGEDGDVVRSAPFEVTTQPGYQMVIRALTDVVGRTYHPNPTESRDVKALELEAFHPVEEILAVGRDVERRVAERVTHDR
jgi:hypothetical protein